MKTEERKVTVTLADKELNWLKEACEDSYNKITNRGINDKDEADKLNFLLEVTKL